MSDIDSFLFETVSNFETGNYVRIINTIEMQRMGLANKCGQIVGCLFNGTCNVAIKGLIRQIYPHNMVKISREEWLKFGAF